MKYLVSNSIMPGNKLPAISLIKIDTVSTTPINIDAITINENDFVSAKCRAKASRKSAIKLSSDYNEHV